MKKTISIGLLLFSVVVFSQTNITIEANNITQEHFAGMGASWHAISADSIDESPDYKYALRYINSRGSAWGGNPPVTNTAAWNQLYKHATWLGFTWIRVELSMRMYEPEKGRFVWDSDEMKALYKILDWAEINNADVFLQQMWSNVKWNSYPQVQPLLSAPKSLDDFADGISTLAEYLLKTKKYTCIKWLCITNEPPGGTWGSWWSKGKDNGQLTPVLKKVRTALDKKNVDILISGPDWTDLPEFDSKKIDFDEYIGAYDIHSYHGMDKEKQKKLEKWTDWAHKHNKPLFLSEVGDMRIGWRKSNPGPKSFAAALSNAETIIRGMEAGVNAFNRWSFTNRGDLDGQWQLVRTWDVEKKEYFNNVKVEPTAFYGYGILTRFCLKNSSIISTKISAKIKNNDSILSQSLKSSSGEITTYILNKSSKDQRVSITYKDLPYDENCFFLYRVTEKSINTSDFAMNPTKRMMLKNAKKVVLILPAKSITTLSTIKKFFIR